jgi:Na+-driven multidrug efflux pump
MIGSLGLPMAIQSGFINISMLFVNSMVNSLDSEGIASATFGVGVRIDDIINKICMGIQYAAMPMISQNIGAGNQKRAKKVVFNAWIISGALTLVFMMLYLGVGEEMFKLFNRFTFRFRDKE